ncbi:MAG: hypothetical protein ACOX0U_03940 [Oscillospiraceae bacterium]
MWADEDFGYNTGKKEYENGEETFCHVPPGGSKEALELALRGSRLGPLADEWLSCLTRKPANTNSVIQTSRCH